MSGITEGTETYTGRMFSEHTPMLNVIKGSKYHLLTSTTIWRHSAPFSRWLLCKLLFLLSVKKKSNKSNGKEGWGKDGGTLARFSSVWGYSPEQQEHKSTIKKLSATETRSLAHFSFPLRVGLPLFSWRSSDIPSWTRPEMCMSPRCF